MIKAIIAAMTTFVLGALASQLNIESIVSISVMGAFIIYFNEQKKQ